MNNFFEAEFHRTLIKDDKYTLTDQVKCPQNTFYPPLEEHMYMRPPTPTVKKMHLYTSNGSVHSIKQANLNLKYISEANPLNNTLQNDYSYHNYISDNPFLSAKNSTYHHHDKNSDFSTFNTPNVYNGLAYSSTPSDVTETMSTYQTPNSFEISYEQAKISDISQTLYTSQKHLQLFYENSTRTQNQEAYSMSLGNINFTQINKDSHQTSNNYSWMHQPIQTSRDTLNENVVGYSTLAGTLSKHNAKFEPNCMPIKRSPNVSETIQNYEFSRDMSEKYIVTEGKALTFEQQFNATKSSASSIAPKLKISLWDAFKEKLELEKKNSKSNENILSSIQTTQHGYFDPANAILSKTSSKYALLSTSEPYYTNNLNDRPIENEYIPQYETPINSSHRPIEKGNLNVFFDQKQKNIEFVENMNTLEDRSVSNIMSFSGSTTETPVFPSYTNFLFKNNNAILSKNTSIAFKPPSTPNETDETHQVAYSNAFYASNYNVHHEINPKKYFQNNGLQKNSTNEYDGMIPNQNFEINSNYINSESTSSHYYSSFSQSNLLENTTKNHISSMPTTHIPYEIDQISIIQSPDDEYPKNETIEMIIPSRYEFGQQPDPVKIVQQSTKELVLNVNENINIECDTEICLTRTTLTTNWTEENVSTKSDFGNLSKEAFEYQNSFISASISNYNNITDHDSPTCANLDFNLDFRADFPCKAYIEKDMSHERMLNIEFNSANIKTSNLDLILASDTQNNYYRNDQATTYVLKSPSDCLLDDNGCLRFILPPSELFIKCYQSNFPIGKSLKLDSNLCVYVLEFIYNQFSQFTDDMKFYQIKNKTVESFSENGLASFPITDKNLQYSLLLDKLRPLYHILNQLNVSQLVDHVGRLYLVDSKMNVSINRIFFQKKNHTFSEQKAFISAFIKMLQQDIHKKIPIDISMVDQETRKDKFNSFILDFNQENGQEINVISSSMGKTGLEDQISAYDLASYQHNMISGNSVDEKVNEQHKEIMKINQFKEIGIDQISEDLSVDTISPLMVTEYKGQDFHYFRDTANKYLATKEYLNTNTSSDLGIPYHIDLKQIDIPSHSTSVLSNSSLPTILSSTRLYKYISDNLKTETSTQPMIHNETSLESFAYQEIMPCEGIGVKIESNINRLDHLESVKNVLYDQELDLKPTYPNDSSLMILNLNNADVEQGSTIANDLIEHDPKQDHDEQCYVRPTGTESVPNWCNQLFNKNIQYPQFLVNVKFESLKDSNECSKIPVGQFGDLISTSLNNNCTLKDNQDLPFHSSDFQLVENHGHYDADELGDGSEHRLSPKNRNSLQSPPSSALCESGILSLHSNNCPISEDTYEKISGKSNSHTDANTNQFEKMAFMREDDNEKEQVPCKINITSFKELANGTMNSNIAMSSNLVNDVNSHHEERDFPSDREDHNDLELNANGFYSKKDDLFSENRLFENDISLSESFINDMDDEIPMNFSSSRVGWEELIKEWSKKGGVVSSAPLLFLFSLLMPQSPSSRKPHSVNQNLPTSTEASSRSSYPEYSKVYDKFNSAKTSIYGKKRKLNVLHTPVKVNHINSISENSSKKSRIW